MNITRWLLIGAAFVIACYFVFRIELWASEYKDMFFYLDNWAGFVGIMLFLLIAKKLFSWFVQAEMRVTSPKKRGRFR